MRATRIVVLPVALFIAFGLAACAGTPTPRAGPKPEYVTKEMVKGRYEGEETGAVFGTKVAYLKPAQAARYILHVQNGLFYDHNGELFSTNQKGAIFSMAADGTLYASNNREPGEFHHSSFTSGGPLAAAGELVIKAGQLEKITDKSGHYEPEPELTVQLLQEFVRLGVKLEGIPLKLEVIGEFDAAEYLKTATAQPTED